MSTGPLIPADFDEWGDPNAELAAQETMVQQPLIDSDARVIAQQIFDRMAERAPGWIARDGNLDVWLIEEFSTVIAEIRAESNSVPQAIFATYATEVLGIPIEVPRAAVGTSTWKAMNNAGYTIPVGTQLTVARTGSDLVAFEVSNTAVIERDTNEISGVPIRCMETGAQGNDLFGPADIIDPLAWVDSVEVEQSTHDGTDGQSEDEYLALVIILCRLVALRPILPWDFAALALRIHGVYRAIAMDGYDPVSKTWGHARTVTLIVTDSEGEPCSNVVKGAVKEYLESLREVNWIVNVIDPEYDPVDVSYHVMAFTGQDPALIEMECNDILRFILSPGQFRLGTDSPSIAAGEVIPPPPPYGPGQGGPNRQSLRVNDLVGVLDRVRGVDYVLHDGVIINGDHDDYLMSSPIALPRPGTITGVVDVQ